jgi:LPS-assembly protein
VTGFKPENIRHVKSGAGRAIAAALMLWLCAGTALAKPLDFSSDEPVNIAAKELTHDEAGQAVTATGNVELVQGGKILRADKIVYNLGTDVVSAIGNVALLDENGDVHTAEYAELSGDLKNGYVQGLLSMLADGSRFTAAEARREDGRRTTMTAGSYTPCKVCEEKPNPIWQIKADKVEHDLEDRSIKYKNARLEVLGVPLAFAPIFSHADPSVERKSGFLRPDYGWSNDVGTFVEGGYYFGDIAPDKDATLRIRPSTRAGVLMMGQWRQRFEAGKLQLDGSGVISDRREEDGRLEEDRKRGHIFASGLYNIDDKWRAGLNIERASDKGYLRFYDISKENVLENEIYAERFSGRNYSRVSAMHFQDVRLGPRPEQPDILPQAEHRMYGEPVGAWGGRWTAGVSTLALHRDDNGQDVQRASADIGWQRRDVLPAGVITQLDLATRGDFYALQDRDAAALNPGRAGNSNRGRVMAVAGVMASYPLVRRFDKAQVVIEPLVGASISPQVDENDSGIPNEDSIDIQLDTSNLFAHNRFPGIDGQEDGARVNYGLRTGLYGDNGRYAKVFVGQSYRFDDDGIFPEGSGLEDNSSDVVGQVNLGLSKYLRADYRFQLDNRHLTMRRHELLAHGGNDLFTLNLGYIYFDGVAGTGFTESREQMQVEGVYRLTPYWSLNAYTLTDLGQEPGLRKASAGITYADECFTFSLQGTRNLINEASGENGTVLMARIGFKNLGEISSPKIQLQREVETP